MQTPELSVVTEQCLVAQAISSSPYKDEVEAMILVAAVDIRNKEGANLGISSWARDTAEFAGKKAPYKGAFKLAVDSCAQEVINGNCERYVIHQEKGKTYLSDK